MSSSSRGKCKRDAGCRSLGDSQQRSSGCAPSVEDLPLPSHAETSWEVDHLTPKDLNVIAFAEKRSREIRTLDDALSTKKANKRVFQQLTRHMRRRAMSYNVKRLPKRLRAAATKETSKTEVPKRPRHKYRKRGRNKKDMYARRSETNGWLETHVWHAKRFHMISKWNRKIGHHPNDKGFRAAFRASNEHCLMTDMSYLVCLELEGPQAQLLTGLQNFTSAAIGRTFAYNDYLAGHLEGSCLLYEANKYPNNVIGPVRFSWLPVVNVSEAAAHRKIHIWSHPSCLTTLIDNLVCVFELQPQRKLLVSRYVTEDIMIVVAGNNEERHLQDVEMKETQFGDEKTVMSPDESIVYTSKTVLLRNMKDDLIRFRLTGPKSTVVLKNVLKPSNLAQGSLDENVEHWWMKVFSDVNALTLAQQQSDAWSSMAYDPSFLDVRAGSMLGLVVRDPRLFRPKMKVDITALNNSKVVEEFPGGSILPDRSTPMATCLISNRDLCQQISSQKISDFEMNKLRSELPAPGMELDLGPREARVPILLIRIGGYDLDQELSRPEYGAGWDLIVPARWAMSFWVPMVYSGARVGGLRELQTVSLHQAGLTHPFDYPDSSAGAVEGSERRKEEEAKFQRYPPDKRPNYIKMACPNPFHCPWEILVRDWKILFQTSNDQSSFDSSSIDFEGVHVIRNLKLLSQLRNVVNGSSTVDKFKVECSEFIHFHRYGLILVCSLFAAGGTSQDFSTICIPNEDDLTQLSHSESFKGPMETPKKDPFRKMAVKERRKLQVEKVLTDPTTVIDASDRRTFGYVVKGGYSFIRGKEMCIGYCSFLGLLEGLSVRSRAAKQNDSLKVLIRPPHSLQYQFADLCLLSQKPTL